MADTTLKLAFILSATDKMSRIVDEAVKKSTDKLSAFERTTSKVGRSMMKSGAMMVGAGAAIGGAMYGAAKSTANYGDEVLKASQRIGVGVEEWQRMAYAAKVSGVENNELADTLAKLGKRVNDAVGGNKTYMQTFKDLGIQLKDATGKLRSPMDVFGDLADVFHSVPNDAEKTVLAMELFGDSGKKLIPLLNKGRAGFKELGDEAALLGLILGEDAVRAGSEFNKDIARLSDSAKGLKMQLGSALIPIISELVTKFTEGINKVVEWARENPQLMATIAKVAMVLAGLLVTVGTASLVFGGLTFIVGQFGKVFRAVSAIIKVGTALIGACKNGMLLFRIQYAALAVQQKAAKVAQWLFNTSIKAGRAIVNTCKNSMLLLRIQYAALVVWQKVAAAAQWLFNSALFACPVVWIVAAIIAIIAAVVLLVKYWDEVVAFFKKIWDWIVNIFKDAWEAIKKVWAAVVGFFAAIWDGIKSAAGKIWDGIVSIFTNAWEAIKSVWSAVTGFFSDLWDGIKSVAGKVWDGIKGVITGVKDGVQAAWSATKGFFSNLWSGIKGIAGKVWGGVKGVITGAKESVQKVWSTTKGFFSSLWGGIKNIAEKSWNSVKGVITGAKEGVQTAWSATKGFFSDLWDGVKSTTTKAWDGIKGWFSNLQPVEWIKGAWDGVGDFFGNLGTRFFEWGANLINSLWDGIKSVAQKAWDGVKSVGNGIASGFKSIFGINSPSRLFTEYGLNITQGLVVGIDRGGAAVESASAGMAAHTTAGITQKLNTSTVSASNIYNGGTAGVNLSYSPQITFNGSITPETREEFRKMLKQHASDVVAIIRRDAENTTRLSFNT